MSLGVFGLCGAIALAVAGPSHLLLFCCLLVIWGGGVGSLYAVGLAHLGSRYRGPDLASANAAFIMLYSLGMLGGPPIAGFGMDPRPAQRVFLLHRRPARALSRSRLRTKVPAIAMARGPRYVARE